MMAVLAGAGVARADIIVEQLPAQYGGPASDTLFINQFDQVVWQQEADNIVLDETATIRHLGWWGFYGGSGTPATPPPANETMRVRFYGARASDGLPDDANIIFEASFQNAVRTPTGKTIAVGGRPDEYRFDVNLPTAVSLQGGTTFWLEIVQIGDLDSLFRWETGYGTVAGLAFKNAGYPSWQSESGSHAFELSTVPEPMTALLLLPVIAFARGRRGKGAVRRGEAGRSSSEDCGEDEGIGTAGSRPVLGGQGKRFPKEHERERTRVRARHIVRRDGGRYGGRDAHTPLGREPGDASEVPPAVASNTKHIVV